MPYRRIQFAPGHYYHIYNRGSRRQPIFRNADNYVFVLRHVKKSVEEFRVSVLAYCLMPNHYHFLMRQDGADAAGLLPQRVFNSYMKAFNKRYGRSSTLFEGRYKAIHVDKECYLIHLCRYIHANPVKDGLVSYLEEWPYSNYHEWIEARNGTLVDRDFVREHFGVAQSYRRFVLDYLAGLDKLPEGIEEYLLE
jgi:putative transposase